MSDDEGLQIYQAHVQSVDRIDERRDFTTRSYGILCAAILSSASIGVINNLLMVSFILFCTLSIVSIAWQLTLESLTAKLIAKSDELKHVENEYGFRVRFLTEERERWERLRSDSESRIIKLKPLSVASKYLPKLLFGFGCISAALSLALAICMPEWWLNLFQI